MTIFPCSYNYPNVVNKKQTQVALIRISVLNLYMEVMLSSMKTNINQVSHVNIILLTNLFYINTQFITYAQS